MSNEDIADLALKQKLAYLISVPNKTTAVLQLETALGIRK
jgi:hypothetical protein